MSDPALCGIILCHFVIREQGTGACTFIRSFSGINPPQFPANIAQFFAIPLLTNLDPKIDTFKVTIRVEDPNSGIVVANSGGELKFPPGFSRNDKMVFELPTPVGPFMVQNPGEYSVVVLVNTEGVGHRTLYIHAPLTTPQIDLDKRE